MAKSRALPCPAGGYLQVRTDHVTHEFGELLQNLRLPSYWRDMVRQQMIEAAQKAGFDPEAMEREKERLRLKRGRILKQHREGYIEDEEMEAEMAAVELVLRALDVPETNGVRLEDVIEAGERLPGMATLWNVATVEERQDMVLQILEPGGLHYDVENWEIAAITPRPAFLPVLRLLDGVVEYEEATGTLVTGRWQQRNRRATNHRSHLYLIPLEKLFPGRTDIIVYKHPTSPLNETESVQRHPGPDDPHWKIPLSEWPTVLRRVEQNQEPLRQVAKDYNVSYEAVRRVLRAARNQQKTG